MDETKEPVNDRNELTNLHYTSRQYIDHHTEDKKNNAICTGYIYCQFDCLRVNPIGGVMVSMFTSSAGRSWVYHHFYES
jgi:hypothetical protein